MSRSTSNIFLGPDTNTNLEDCSFISCRGRLPHFSLNIHYFHRRINMKAISLILSLALSSLALAAPAKQKANNNNPAIASTVKDANVAVLRFDNAVQMVNSSDSGVLQPVLRKGTQAVTIIQNSASNVQSSGRTGVQGAPSAQQAGMDFMRKLHHLAHLFFSVSDLVFPVAMNKVADDLVGKRDLIMAAGSGPAFLDVYTAQANAGMDLINDIMAAMPPRERNNAAQAFAVLPDGLSKVQAAFAPSPQ
jgi:hypothetical protein